MARTKSPIIEELHSLHTQPTQQAAFAATLLQGKQGKDVMQAALAVLASNPHHAARDDLLHLYTYYMDNKGVRDPGAYFRRALIDAIHPIARRDDAALFARAAVTYEFWPPDFAEDAVLLRAAGLVALGEVDDELARFYAARLLVDPYVQPMSGEPATTAARVLGALNELTVLWSYVMAEHPPQLAEVVAECLRQLETLPEPLLPVLIERFGPSAPMTSRLGLVQLLINHEATGQASGAGATAARAALRKQLQESSDIDVFNFIVMSMVASGREPLLADLLECAKTIRQRDKLIVLAEAFTLLAHQLPFRQEAANLQRRLAGDRKG